MNIKSMLLLLGTILLAAGLYHWFQEAPEEEEEEVETEVAVRVGRLSRATLHDYVSVYGLVEPAPGDKNRPAAASRVSPAVAGVITGVSCFEGIQVEKGALLFQLDNRVAEAQVEKARHGVHFAELNLQRVQHLHASQNASQKQLEEAEMSLAAGRAEEAAARAQSALLQVIAPLSGTVTRVHARPGEMVDASSVLAEIIDMERLVVTAHVPSGEAGSLQLGQPVELLPNHDPGVLTVVAPDLDPGTDTIMVRAAFPRDAGLTPGAFVQIRIVTAEHSNRLVSPEESVVSLDGATVIAVVEGGIATRNPVRVGLREGGLIEVEGDGLVEGMVIVTTGAYGLPPQTKIRVLNP